MAYGSFFGKKRIVRLMISHPVAVELYSSKIIKIIRNIGHLFFLIFGYPLNVIQRRNSVNNLNMLKPKKGEKILDAGCGAGHFCFELSNKFGCEEGLQKNWIQNIK